MDPFLGEIRPFAGTFAPNRWAFCDGQVLQISQNTALFSLLGTTYGGDGRTTFALPDLRGRLPMGVGAGPGLSPRDLGRATGDEGVALTTSQLPAHTHGVGTADGRTTSRPTGGVPAPGGAYGAGGAGQAADAAVGAAGETRAHENRAPALTISWIIALQGVFPQRP